MHHDDRDHRPDQPSAPGRPAWALGREANFHFERAPGHYAAAATFRRRPRTPEPEPADPQPEMMEAVRRQLQHSCLVASDGSLIGAGGTEALAKQKAALADTLAACDRLDADLRRREQDPALLRAADFAGQIAAIDREKAVLDDQRGKARAELDKVERLAGRALALVRRAVEDALRFKEEERRRELTERHARLLTSLAEAAAPLLEELLAVEAALKLRADVGRMTEELMGGGAEGPSAPAEAA